MPHAVRAKARTFSRPPERAKTGVFVSPNTRDDDGAATVALWWTQKGRERGIKWISRVGGKEVDTGERDGVCTHARVAHPLVDATEESLHLVCVLKK